MSNGVRIVVDVFAVVACVFAILFAIWSRGDAVDRVVVSYDTITVIERDTLTVCRYIPTTRYCYDTVRVSDTVYIRDEPRRYIDSTSDYRLAINAVKLYDYTLDIYRADTFTRYIPKVPSEPKKNGKFGQSVVLGLQVGYGLGVSPATMQARFEPYIGIGLTYGFGFNFN